jgi:hypothetical protein
VSWLEGHSLAQTVFTNLYLHQPAQILDKPLKTFCYAVYKIIEIIKDCINKALVFEEEDFQSVTYGYRLQQDITEQKTISMLREVEEELHRKSRIKLVDVESEKEVILIIHFLFDLQIFEYIFFFNLTIFLIHLIYFSLIHLFIGFVVTLIYLQYNDGIALYARIRFTKMFYQVLMRKNIFNIFYETRCY